MSSEIKVHVVDYNRTNLVLQYVDPVTGKRKTKSARTPNRKLAKERAIEWQTELRNGLYKEPSRLTWSEFRERYDREYMQCELKSTSQDRVHATFNVIESLMAPSRLQQITSQWVTQFRLKASEGRSIETVNIHLRNLKAALNWAKSQKLIAEIPTIKQSRKGRSSKQMKGRPITAEEFDRMIEAVPKVSAIGQEWAPDWQHFLRGLWWSGLRLSEALSLTWDQWADGIRVSVSNGYVFLLISAEHEKGGKDRMYPVAPEFSELLLATPERKRTGFVFNLPQAGNNRPNRRDTGRKICDIGKLAGVKVDEGERMGQPHTKFASAHDLRRAFGFRWSRRIFPAELMELMRHENISTTMNYYVGQQAELTARKLQQAIESERTPGSAVSPQRTTSRS